MENQVSEIGVAPQGTGQFAGKASPPGVPAQLQGALEVAKQAFQRSQQMLSTVAPYLKAIEVIEKQIVGVQAILTAKFAHNIEEEPEQDRLAELYNMLDDALESYQSKIADEEEKAKQA